MASRILPGVQREIQLQLEKRLASGFGGAFLLELSDEGNEIFDFGSRKGLAPCWAKVRFADGGRALADRSGQVSVASAADKLSRGQVGWRRVEGRSKEASIAASLLSVARSAVLLEEAASLF
jgi:hypothetical protein